MERKWSWKRLGWAGYVLLAVLSLVGSSLAGSPAHAVPSLQFSSPNVAVTQVAPGASVALFYVGHRWQDPVVRRETLCQKLTDSDYDGAIAFDYGGELVRKAIWVVSELANGNVSVGAPDGFQPTAFAPAIGKLLEVPGHIVVPRQSLHLLLVRPGVDAWKGSSFDGAASDVDAADNGEVRLRVLAMKSLSTGENPAGKFSVETGDVLVGLDPELLTYFVVTVP